MASEYSKIKHRIEERSNLSLKSKVPVFDRERKRKLWKSREIVLEILADRGITDTSPNDTVKFEEFEEWIGEDDECSTFINMKMCVKKNVNVKSVKSKGTNNAYVEELTLVKWISNAGTQDLEGIAIDARKDNITNVIVCVCDGDIKHPAKSFVDEASKVGVYFQLYTLDELQFNVSKHRLVPEHTFATKADIRAIKNEYRITKVSIPRIPREDPQVRHLAAKPGDILKIKRPSITMPDYFDVTYSVVS